MKIRSRRREIILKLAREYIQEGVLELDQNAKISEGDDNGAYVQMWKWVDFANTRLCKNEDSCSDGCPVHG